MEPLNPTEQNIQAQDFAALEQPLRELNAEEADQVQGGFVGSANGGVWKAAPVELPTPLKVKMTDVLISS
jgi:hypothetical protein